MGVVGTTKHLESSRIIAPLDVSHSEERLGQFTMENGEFFFHTKSPKFKRQIVSAVRDFPPGCGRFARLNSLRHAKDATSVSTSDSVPTESLVSRGKNVGGHRGVEKLMISNGQGDETNLMNGNDVDSVETVESVSALEHERSDSLKNLLQLNNLRPVEEAASVGTAESLISRDTNVDGKRVENLTDHVHETDLMNGKASGTVEMIVPVTDLEHEASDLLKSMHQLSNNLRPVDEVASVGTAEYFLRRGKNGDGQEIDKLMVSTGQVDETVSMTVETVESLTALQNEVSELGVAVPKEEMVAVLSDRNFCSPPDGSISVSIGNCLEKTAAKKCPSRRLVSAVRDFPPLCGRNACKFGQVKSCMGDEPSQSNTAKTSVKQIREDFQEEFHKKELGGNVSEVIRDKVQPKCKGHAVQEMERQDKCKPSYKPKVVWKDTIEKCIEKSPQQSSQLPSNRVIVLALMAPSNSQFRKGRMVRKHIPDGGMSERKRKKLHLKC
ncbi:PREDICTED: histone-lysine N-methyltransferase [Prunus dulcis]|uniref:PREDICTED: histone-lysine N-methyltransferase n=1 Tax=Prunus dulcis TaxID=3755 RepID=A0A5E4GM31_PRUDU|nr:uncharacterized protein LOC117628102 [Prunus dulcis]VVA40935.1 PREDICTED: histone-lysine N-methyltransferase [Prunus dulcis]